MQEEDRHDRVIGETLREDHARMEEALARMRATLQEDRDSHMQAEWTDFERATLAHFDWEEAHLFPRYRVDHPDEVALLERDHRHFRQQLGQFGIDIELHAVRVECFDELADELRAHAQRESPMYDWSDTEERPERRSAMIARLRALLR